MLKKTITYTDYNGEERKEDFYFNLNRAEVIEMEIGTAGGYAEMLKRIVETRDGAQIMKVFKTLILKSYGIKSPDGKQFQKSEEITKAFEQSEAYSELFVSLCTNAEEAVKFINGVLPMTEEQRKQAAVKAAEYKSEITGIPSNT